MFSPSKFQSAIFDCFQNTLKNIIIQAVAGSGKTTTLLELMNLIPKTSSALFLCFNKSIQVELSKKVPSHVEAVTLHTAGLRILSKNRKVNIDTNKLSKIADFIPELSTYNSGKQYPIILERRSIVLQLVSAFKFSLCNVNDPNSINELINTYSIDAEDIHIRLAKELLQKSISKNSSIDFDDMIYLPVIQNFKTPKYDYILVDECQDLNFAQIELVKMLVGDSGRLIAVGDFFQSLYGFRGADSKAMFRIQGNFNAMELPLSVCYRCPKSHIKLAQDIVPHIEASDTAIEGTISNINIDELVSKGNNNDLIVSRTNAPLVGAALKFIAQGKKAIVRGQDIGKNLVGLVNKLNANDIVDLQSKLYTWAENETRKLEAKKASDSRINSVKDKVQTIETIADNCNSISEVISKIQSIFSDAVSGIVLSTVHKAKGLEADNVFILNPKTLPLIWKNQKTWELDQEMNIKYVALTRAKKELTFVHMD